MIPKNIEFKEITHSNINLFWNIDDINILNIDNNKIKFIVEMRKDDEKFKKIYEGNNTNCSIKNLDENTNYEIKICSFYENIIGEWSPIQKIKTLKLDIVKYNSLLKDNNDYFKFKFRPGVNYIIKDNGLIATKNGVLGWNCSIIGDKEIPKDNISKWKIKVNNIADNSINDWNILVGIGPDNKNNENNFQRKCWSFICGNSKINLRSKEEKFAEKKVKIKNNDK